MGLTGPFEVQGDKGHRLLLSMAHRVNKEGRHMLIPWTVTIKRKSDAPQEILRTICRNPVLG
eukprot:1060955-Prorocentrum_lima.AAC.1